MSTGTKWTPELIAARLTVAHARWLEDGGYGKPFTPAYLRATGDRQIYGQRRVLFRAALGIVSEEVRDDWGSRDHRIWHERFCVTRIKELFEEWRRDVRHGQPAGKRWAVSYIDAVDHPFLRTTYRHQVRIDDLVKRIGGELCLRWWRTKKLQRRPRVALRTIQSAAKEIIAAYHRWCIDKKLGKPAGRPFGGRYLRNIKEERLDAWMRRNDAYATVFDFYAPAAVGKAWTGRGHMEVVAPTGLS